MPFKETDMDLYVYEFMGGSHGPGSRVTIVPISNN